MNAEQEAWANAQPPAVAARVHAYPPTQWYRLKSTGQKVWIHSYSEALDGSCDTCRVHVHEEYTPFVIEVFGVSYDDLEPWEGKDG